MDFKEFISIRAKAQCGLLGVSDAEAVAVSGAVIAAILTATATAKDGGAAIRACSEDSIATCIAASIRTRLLPGGRYAPVYLVPRRGALVWSINHLGLLALAARDGIEVRAIPVHRDDTLTVDKIAAICTLDSSPDAWANSAETLRGVIVAVAPMDGVGRQHQHWVPLPVIERARSASQIKGDGPWATDYAAMACAAAIRAITARGALRMGAHLGSALAYEAAGSDVADVADVAAGRDRLGLPPAVSDVVSESAPTPTPRPAPAPKRTRARQLVEQLPDDIDDAPAEGERVPAPAEGEFVPAEAKAKRPGGWGFSTGGGGK